MAPVRAGRKEPLPGYRTVRKQVEETPKIAKREMVWHRGKGTDRNLRPAAIKRKRNSVIARNPLPDEYATVHTHIQKSSFFRIIKTKGRAIPGWSDFKSFLWHLRNSNVRFLHLISISPSGTVSGYTSMYATKKFCESTNIQEKIGTHVEALKQKKIPASGALLIELKEAGLLKVHFRPMPGYYLDAETKQFLPKPKTT